LYLKHFEAIVGTQLFKEKERENLVCLVIANFIRKLANGEQGLLDVEPTAQRLYQNKLVWLLMKDIICPVFQVPIINHKVLCYGTACFDISGVYKKDDVNDDDDKDEISVFLNAQIEYLPCRDASLFISSIKRHGLDTALVISELFDSEIYEQVEGLAKLAFTDDNSFIDFIYFVKTFSGNENSIEHILVKSQTINKKLHKKAQHPYYARNLTNGSWWYWGILEQMLESARGANWDTYKNLYPYLKEIWDKIHIARRKKGRDGLNYEALLRVKEKDDNRTPRILEALLGTTRVW
jgi:hypothetical protein